MGIAEGLLGVSESLGQIAETQSSQALQLYAARADQRERDRMYEWRKFENEQAQGWKQKSYDLQQKQFGISEKEFGLREGEFKLKQEKFNAADWQLEATEVNDYDEYGNITGSHVEKFIWNKKDPTQTASMGLYGWEWHDSTGGMSGGLLDNYPDRN
ncbi:uncharacterized protein METZ01_LOCUS229403, partial [marine metagenome]